MGNTDTIKSKTGRKVAIIEVDGYGCYSVYFGQDIDGEFVPSYAKPTSHGYKTIAGARRAANAWTK